MPAEVRLVCGLACCAMILVAAGACRSGSPAASVTVYASVDQVYAEPALDDFEVRSGVKVNAVYDVEAAKTTGLVNRLIQEQSQPQADVWWSGEFAQTVELADKGVLQAYESPSATAIPPAYRDPEGRWAGFGGRARVLIANTDRLSEDQMPSSIYDLAEGDIPADEVAIAYPVFGTTATHAAALYAALGRDEARAYFESLRDRGVLLLDGNSVVRDQVASGQLALGLADTDDACVAVAHGEPVRLIFPDQGADELGTLIIPNTVAMVAGARHPDQAHQLIDYLLSPEVEANLMRAGWFQLSLRPNDVHLDCPEQTDVKGMSVSLTDVAAHIEEAKADMAAVFVR